MKWLRDLLAHFPHPTDRRRAEPQDARARRQWQKVRETDKVLKAYRELDVVLKLDARHRQ